MTFRASDVTVLIPTRNRRDLVLDAIESAREQTVQAAEILVVDDGSNDGTAEAIRALDASGTPVRVIPGPGNWITSSDLFSLPEWFNSPFKFPSLNAVGKASKLRTNIFMGWSYRKKI